MPYKFTKRPNHAHDWKPYFWERIRKIDGGCWEWEAAKGSSGYGEFQINKRNHLTHRLSYELHYGPIPEGLWVLHKCDNKPCVNPGHLFLGDREANTADMVAKGRQATGERNSSIAHPERLSRGNNHYARREPHRLARGNRHWTRKNPHLLPVGEKSTNAKLTADAVLSMRREFRLGVPGNALGKKYGISHSLACRIVKGLAWKHLPLNP